MSLLPYLAAPAFLTAIGGAIAWLYRARQQQKKAPDEKLNAAIEQWKQILGGSVDELREQNAYQATLIVKQREQIDELEAENEKLERLVKTVTQQSMDAAHREARMTEKYEALMQEHGRILRRLEEMGERDDVA
jgi:cell division protein FtsB